MSLQGLIGNMRSGKSDELLCRKRLFEVAQKRCVLIKYLGDTRWASADSRVQSRSGQSAVATYVVRDLMSILDQVVKEADVVLIDEAQFYKDLVQFCETLVGPAHRKVVVYAALNSTFERKPFPQVAELIAMSDKLDFYRAICQNCGKKGAFSKRLDPTNKKLEVIGDENYASLCRSCFDKND